MSPSRGLSRKDRNASTSMIVPVPTMMAPAPRTTVIAR